MTRCCSPDFPTLHLSLLLLLLRHTIALLRNGFLETNAVLVLGAIEHF